MLCKSSIFSFAWISFRSTFHVIVAFWYDSIPDPEGQLPEESLDASNLKKNFLAKGFT